MRWKVSEYGFVMVLVALYNSSTVSQIHQEVSIRNFQYVTFLSDMVRFTQFYKVCLLVLLMLFTLV